MLAKELLNNVLVVLIDQSIEIEREKDNPEKFILLEDAFNVIETFKEDMKGVEMK